MNKKIYSMTIVLLTLIITPSFVNAKCTNEEISALKKETKAIKVEYEHKGETITEDGGIDYNKFNVDIINIPNEYYIIISDGLNYKLVPTDGKITKELTNGKWIIEVYSNKCEDVIDTITVRLPKFNIYSLDPLCDGIDGDKFPLCGKYYEYEVGYDSFKERVEHYRKTYKIDTKKEEQQTNEKDFLTKTLNFINTYKLYIVSFLTIVLIILVIINIIKKRRNRGVLK